jgi:hypothetical protein
MQTIVADEVLRNRLGGLMDEIEVRDESGQLLGRFVPVRTGKTQAQKTYPFTEDDLDRVRQEPGGKKLAEIWRSLDRTP